LPNADQQGTIPSILSLLKRNAELEAQLTVLSDARKLQIALEEKYQVRSLVRHSFW